MNEFHRFAEKRGSASNGGITLSSGKKGKFGVCAALVARVLVLAISLAPLSAAADTTSGDYDYRYSGVGNKYSEGLEGYDLEAGRGQNAATDRAGDETKRGDNYRDRANELNGMSNQIGQDRNSLIPRLQQAQAQDRANPNSSGASRVQTLFQQKYDGPKKYEEAYRALGLSRVLDTQGNLYHKGPAVQKQLEERANHLSEAAENSYKQASQGMAAARQLQNFRQIANSRKAGMGSLPVGTGNHNSFQLAKKGAGLSGEEGKGDGTFGSNSQGRSDSDISRGSGWDLRTGGPANAVKRADLAAALRNGDTKNQAGKKSEGIRSTLEERKKSLSALGAAYMKPITPIYPKGYEPGGLEGTAFGELGAAQKAEVPGGRAPASVGGSAEAVNSVLEAVASNNSGGAETPSGSSPDSAAVGAFSAVQAGLSLEDGDTLFQRVRVAHARAAKAGLVSPAAR